MVTLARPNVPQARRVPVAWQVYGAPALTVLAVVGALYSSIGVHNAHLEDFQIFRQSAWQVLHGQSPYAGLMNNNAPAVTLAFVPWAWLPAWPVAAVSFLALSLTALVWTLRAAFPQTWPTWVAVVVAVDPSLVALRQGQLAPFLMALLAYAWRTDQQGHRDRSALALGLLMGAKPFYGVFLLYRAWERRWRDCALMLGVAASVWLLGLTLGVSVTAEWLTGLHQLTAFPQHPGNVTPWGLGSRLFAAPDSTIPFHLVATPILISPIARWATALLVGGPVLWLCLRTIQVGSEATQWALIGLLPLVLSPFAEAYYLLVPLVPLIEAATEVRAWAVGGSALLFLLPFDVLIAYRDQPETWRIMLGLRSYLTWATMALMVTAARALYPSGPPIVRSGRDRGQTPRVSPHEAPSRSSANQRASLLAGQQQHLPLVGQSAQIPLHLRQGVPQDVEVGRIRLPAPSDRIVIRFRRRHRRNPLHGRQHPRKPIRNRPELHNTV